MLRFDFSMVSDALETLKERFEGHCHTELHGALRRHPDLFPEAALREILAARPSPGSSASCSGVSATKAMALMGEWYNGYRFSEDADTDLYNTDMVLYYLSTRSPTGACRRT